MTTKESPKISLLESKEKLLQALKSKAGKATLGDLIVGSGLPKGDAEEALRSLLGEYESHLAVDDKGDILYLFDPDFVRRGDRERRARAWRQFKAALWRGFVAAFKIIIMLVLVVYFVVFVVLVIAAIVAMLSSRGDNRSSSSSSSSSSSGGGMNWIFWFWGGPRHSSRSNSWEYGGRNQRQSQKPEDERPFYKKVFSFVFGPEMPARDLLAEGRAKLSWIRTMKGRITAADLASRTGSSLRVADEEATKLIVDFGGDVEVTEEGTLVYTFKELMVEGGGKRADAKPMPAYWSQYEEKPLLTGNTSGTNAAIIFFNAFNLLAAVSSPFFIFPALRLEGVGPMIGLFYIPLVFSSVFFAVPLLRSFASAAEERRRVERNLRRAALETLFTAAQKRPVQFIPVNATGAVLNRYSGRASSAFEPVTPAAAQAQVELLLHDFEGEPTNNGAGTVVYDFDRLARELAEVEAQRKDVVEAESKMGEIVYSSRS